MENKSHALIAGLFTLAMIIIAVVLGMWFTRDRVERVPYEMVTKLSIPGLNPQAAVRYRGLDVGVVDKISFDPKVVGQILVHMNIKAGTPITKSTFGVLGYQGVTGIAYVQLDDDGTNPVRLHSTKENTARIEMRPSLLDQLQDRGLAILIQTDELAKRLNNLLSPDNQKTVLSAFQSITDAAKQIETIPRQLKPTLDRLPALTRETQLTMQSVNKLSNNLDRLATTLQAQDGAVERVAKAADQLGSAANEVEQKFAPLTKDVRSATRAATRTLETVNDRPQGLLFGGAVVRPGPGEPGFTDK